MTRHFIALTLLLLGCSSAPFTSARLATSDGGAGSSSAGVAGSGAGGSREGGAGAAGDAQDAGDGGVEAQGGSDAGDAMAAAGAAGDDAGGSAGKNGCERNAALDYWCTEGGTAWSATPESPQCAPCAYIGVVWCC